MSWNSRRKFIYALATLVFCTALTVYVLRDVIFPNPTCFDQKHNGFEAGVDCGGECSLRCDSEVIPLEVVWARFIPVSNGAYDLVGMVSNKNINNASHVLGYTFTLYDAQGNTIERSGTTTSPVDGDFPIIVQSVHLTRQPVSISLSLQDTPHYRSEERPTDPTLRTGNELYEPGSIPRLSFMVMNTKRVVLRNTPIKVILFDEKDNAYAVAQTVVPELNKEEVKDITVTWDNPLPFAPTKIRIYPIFNPVFSE